MRTIPTTQCVKIDSLRTAYDEGMDLQMWMNPRLYPNHLYVGRKGRIFIHNTEIADGVTINTNEIFHYPGSVWASPFKVGTGVGKYSLEESLRLYREMIVAKMTTRLHELEGKVLGCFCNQSKPGINCHAKVLVELYQEYCM